MHRGIDARLRRLERTHLPVEPMRALIIQARPEEDVAPRIAEATAAGTHRPNWPLVVLRAADWPTHREGRIGGTAP